MERHLLLTVNAYHTYKHAPRFVSYFFKGDTNPRLTLFCVTPNPHTSVDLTRDALSNINEANMLEASYKRKGNEALAIAKKFLIDNGFPQEKIETKLQVRQYGTVMDIIQEAERGYYDAVVFGRRGLSMFEEFVNESVSRQMLREQISFPLWICKEPEPDRKNVLLCVDGSEQSQNVADHVGFMLAKSRRHNVTLFHVGEESRAPFEAPRTALVDAGFPEEKIENKAVAGSNVAKTIMEYALTNNYAAIALGTTGAGQKYLQTFFMGSVCLTIFKALKKVSLIVSQ